MNDIVKIFNSDDLAEMKTAMRNVVVNKFERELEEMGMWLFDDKAVEEMIYEMYGEIIIEVKDEIKRKITEQVMSKLDGKILA